MASRALLPEQDELLCELADAYSEAGGRPQIRMGLEGRTGARVWMWGQPRRELTGSRKPEDFAELRANGDLRQVKRDKTGTYYALTPAGLKRRAEIAKKTSSKPAHVAAQRTGPPPEVLASAPCRLELLRALAADVRKALDAVLAVSSVNDTFAGLPIISPHPWGWAPLAPEHQRLIGAARKALDAWFEGARGGILASASERIEDFIDEEESLLRVVDRSSRSDGPTAPDIAGTHSATPT